MYVLFIAHAIVHALPLAEKNNLVQQHDLLPLVEFRPCIPDTLGALLLFIKALWEQACEGVGPDYSETMCALDLF